AALTLTGLSDLHQEFPALSEFQDHIVIERGVARDLNFRSRQSWSAGRRGSPTVAADPDVPLIVHRDSMVGDWPVITFARSAPICEEVALLVKLQNRRRRRAAFRGGGTRCRVVFHSFERAPPMNDPNMVLTVDRYADGHSEEPM